MHAEDDICRGDLNPARPPGTTPFSRARSVELYHLGESRGPGVVPLPDLLWQAIGRNEPHQQKNRSILILPILD